MSFDTIKDQEVAVQLLRNLLRKRRIPNGLVFWGPGGVGKRLTALELAKAINCSAKEDEACDACLSCRKVASGNHPDILTVVPVRNSRVIDLDTMKEVTGSAALRPYESSWRVFLIQDADRMNPHAQNHFLKTLEEPPGQSMFLLITEFPGLLLPTIRSRCQMVRFRTLRQATVVSLLERERDLACEVAESIAAIAQGQMSRALDLVDSEKREIALAVAHRLAQGDDPVILAEEFCKSLEDQRRQLEARVRADLAYGDKDERSREDLDELKEQRMALLNAMVKRDIMEYLYLLETWYRDALVYGATGDRMRLMNRDQAATLQTAMSSDPGKKIEAIDRARQHLDRYINEERVFRDLFFALAEK